MRKWEDLPDFMRIPEVKPYWNILRKKHFSLFFKRALDFLIAFILLLILAIPLLIVSVCIKLDSKGPVFYRQKRVTVYGKQFYIHKFRTMVNNADKIGTSVTVGNDSRITKFGAKIRDSRIDEWPQIIDVLFGQMSFVGTRPEIKKYVEKYKPEYYATLLMRAGITSEASLYFKDEAKLLNKTDNIDETYINSVLPEKMKWNLLGIVRYSFWKDIKIMFMTVFTVAKKHSTIDNDPKEANEKHSANHGHNNQ